jgi:sugar phosphate isomerase/epimerase
MTDPARRSFLQGAAAAAVTGCLANPGFAQQPQPAARTAAPYRLGIVTYNIAARWDLNTLLRICRNVGIAAVELRTTHAHHVEPTLNAQERQQVRRRFQDAGVQIWGSGTVCEFHSPDAAVVRRNIDTCRDFIRLVADIGGRGVKVRPNALPDGVPVARTLDQIGRALRTCGQAAADANVEIWVEVHGRGTAHPPHIRTMMQTADHRSVGVTWNSNGTDIQNGSIREYFQLLRPWVRSVHIHDLYENYPYRELFRLLRDMRYDRYTLAEIDGTPDAASGERLLRFYKALWEEWTIQ